VSFLPVTAIAHTFRTARDLGEVRYDA
jgi:hypothetical protein